MAKKIVRKPRKRTLNRQRSTAKFKLAADVDIDYKDIPLLQKFISGRGKMIPRRITGVSAKNQRRLSIAIKRARFLALLITGGIQK